MEIEPDVQPGRARRATSRNAVAGSCVRGLGAAGACAHSPLVTDQVHTGKLELLRAAAQQRERARFLLALDRDDRKARGDQQLELVLVL